MSNARVTAAMATEQVRPSNIGLALFRTNFIGLVLRPIVAIAITIKKRLAIRSHSIITGGRRNRVAMIEATRNHKNESWEFDLELISNIAPLSINIARQNNSYRNNR